MTAMSNRTTVSVFLLDGFSDCQNCQIQIFSILFLIYILTVLENLTVILLVIQNNKLWKPMYIFIGNLSFLEIGYINVSLPKILFNIITKSREISYYGCLSQLFMFIFLASVECYLLASMAYDRYVAICNPLRYTDIMQNKCVLSLLACSWLIGLFMPVIPIHFHNQTDFCGSNKIDHFFCDASPLLSLACGNTVVEELVDSTFATFVLVTSLSLIIFSYFNIMQTVLKMPASVHQKAFSTCTSHLVIICIFYGSLCFTYVRVSPAPGVSSDKFVSILYSFVTPLVNPVIYTLRNSDIRVSLQKVFAKTCLKSELYYNKIKASVSRPMH